MRTAGRLLSLSAAALFALSNVTFASTTFVLDQKAALQNSAQSQFIQVADNKEHKDDKHDSNGHDNDDKKDDHHDSSEHKSKGDKQGDSH
ncbi:hypothetical protein [Flexibacterium corallicola]|uniref:hypothetical protein n=1 Tax=Flexibacterium corallicola TaxID=3037259 RepID=UPI00286F14B9|nr:hypothetical protein [Pseudovibrio sp. M1P-2-3]